MSAVGSSAISRSAVSRLQMFVVLVASMALLYASTANAAYSTVFVACYAGIYFALVHVYRGHGHIDLFSPVVAIPVLVLLYSWGSGLFVDATGRTPFDDSIQDSTRAIFYVCGLVGVAGFMAGAISAQRVTVLPFRVAADPAVVPSSWYLVAGVIGVAWAVIFFADVFPRFNFTDVESYYDTAFQSRVDRMEDVTAGVREVFTIYPAVVLIISFATIAVLKKDVPLPIKVIAGVILAAYFARNTLAGSRQTIVQALLLLAMYYHYHIKAVRPVATALAGAGLYLFVNLITVARRTADPIEMLGYVVTYLTDVGASGLGLAASGELVTGANLHKLIEGLNSGLSDYMYGRNVINEILVFVPRVLYPDRPNSMAEEFVAQFYPGVLEAGGGYGFFILQEGYWMLGLPGILIAMYLYGFGLERLYRWFLRNSHSSLATILYAWLYSELCVSAVRGGMISSLRASMFLAFPLLVLWWCLATLRKRIAARQ
ncbi:MAG TPA: hypothetical protein VFL30_01530 [Rhodanobacteraceae bacterium]|nr:hypothetical protein [Rhodanobacteraceae bacterium]